MRKIFTYLLALATVTTVVSCDDNDDPEPIVEPVAGPTITWASNPDFKKMDITEEMDVKINVDAPAGIKTFKVAVKSEVLNGMGITELDLIEPGSDVKEYVDMILGEAGSLKDKTSYSLDLSKLVLKINDFTDEDSDHTFTLTVGDKNDSIAMKTAVFHRVEEMFKMVYVEGGTFMMGMDASDPDASLADSPIHKVTLSRGYYIGKYEVTQEQWIKIMGENPSQFPGTNMPVEKVSWNDVQIFIEKLNEETGKNYRLPTEAEWEFAARGGNLSKGYKYSGSNNVEEVAWYNGNSEKTTHPVGTKAPNELGIYDMTGNVQEWCSDWYKLKYYNESPEVDPLGAESGTYRVQRGAAFSQSERQCRVAHRASIQPDKGLSGYGFRLACDIP